MDKSTLKFIWKCKNLESTKQVYKRRKLEHYMILRLNVNLQQPRLLGTGARQTFKSKEQNRVQKQTNLINSLSTKIQRRKDRFPQMRGVGAGGGGLTLTSPHATHRASLQMARRPRCEASHWKCGKDPQGKTFTAVEGAEVSQNTKSTNYKRMHLPSGRMKNPYAQNTARRKTKMQATAPEATSTTAHPRKDSRPGAVRGILKLNEHGP